MAANMHRYIIYVNPGKQYVYVLAFVVHECFSYTHTHGLESHRLSRLTICQQSLVQNSKHHGFEKKEFAKALVGHVIIHQLSKRQTKENNCSKSIQATLQVSALYKRRRSGDGVGRIQYCRTNCILQVIVFSYK